MFKLSRWFQYLMLIASPIAVKVNPKYYTICSCYFSAKYAHFWCKNKTCWHQNREVSKDWCFSKLTTPRFVKRRKYIRGCKKSNTMGVTCLSGNTNPSEHLCSPMVFSDVLLARSLVFCVIFCRWLFVFLPFLVSVNDSIYVF